MVDVVNAARVRWRLYRRLSTGRRRSAPSSHPASTRPSRRSVQEQHHRPQPQDRHDLDHRFDGPDKTNPFFTTVIHAIQEVAHQHDYSVLLCCSDEDPERSGRTCGYWPIAWSTASSSPPPARRLNCAASWRGAAPHPGQPLAQFPAIGSHRQRPQQHADVALRPFAVQAAAAARAWDPQSLAAAAGRGRSRLLRARPGDVDGIPYDDTGTPLGELLVGPPPHVVLHGFN